MNLSLGAPMSDAPAVLICVYACKLTSVCVQQLRFMPPWLTARQTAFDQLIRKTQPAELITSSSAMAERPRELGDFKKARVNGGTDSLTINLLRIPSSHKCLHSR